MMVLVSDLHLTDGSVARNVNPEGFQLFGDEVAGGGKARRQGDPLGPAGGHVRCRA
jgi:hypothetical protein